MSSEVSDPERGASPCGLPTVGILVGIRRGPLRRRRRVVPTIEGAHMAKLAQTGGPRAAVFVVGLALAIGVMAIRSQAAKTTTPNPKASWTFHDDYVGPDGVPV